jgi:hypothetical protein
MYWCKRAAFILSAAALISGLQACKPEIKETGGTLAFFDLKGYFKADSARLTQSHPLVTKMVKHNNDEQTRQVHISNWGEELSLFSQSDINKPAWRASYKAETSPGFIIYTAKDLKLVTRRIVISRDSSTQKVKWIMINNYTKNLLYTSAEKLTYYPDSVYQIEKKQVIRLVGTNRYLVKGRIISGGR